MVSKSVVLKFGFIGAAILALLLYLGSPLGRAQLAVRKDLLLGRPKYFLYGEPVPYENELREIMRQRYGISLVGPAGCIVSEPNVRRWNLYNRTVSKHFGFGGQRDLFQSTLNELILAHQQDKQ